MGPTFTTHSKYLRSTEYPGSCPFQNKSTINQFTLGNKSSWGKHWKTTYWFWYNNMVSKQTTITYRHLAEYKSLYLVSVWIDPYFYIQEKYRFVKVSHNTCCACCVCTASQPQQFHILILIIWIISNGTAQHAIPSNEWITFVVLSKSF